MEWVLLVRPMRAALLLVFLLGCFISSRMGVGPVFILVSGHSSDKGVQLFITQCHTAPVLA